MGRGLLAFKGEEKAKKKKSKSKHRVPALSSSSDDHLSRNVGSSTEEAAAAVSQSVPTKESKKMESPQVKTGTGLITTSGTVVTGYNTRFQQEISVGDAILVNLRNGQQEMRVVTMRLSDISINLSSPFSENAANPISFQYIQKPKDVTRETKIAKEKAKLESKLEETKASGVFGSSDEVVYREKTEHGSYRIKKAKVSGDGITRGDMLEIRSKKAHDKYC